MLKMARESEKISVPLERFTRQEDSLQGNHFLHFDMVRNFYNEQLPANLLNCLKHSRASAKREDRWIPHFVNFNRHEMALSLQISLEPVMLRSIVGNRTLMARLAPKIVSLLLKGMIDVHKKGLVI